MLKWFRTDLHVHTCLSPCADLRMSPRRIVGEALHQKLDIVAVTDHNSAANVSAVMKAAEGTSLAVLPGMEVCTREEVHVVAIFDMLSSAIDFQSEVYDRLTGRNDPETFGLQVIANALDEVEGFEERLLIGAVDLSIDDVVRKIHQLNGLAIAAHIDRESFGIIGHLGFVPPSVRFDALELSAAISDSDASRRFQMLSRQFLVRSSDAHCPSDLGGGKTHFLLEHPTCEELRRAFLHENGRKASIEQPAE